MKKDEKFTNQLIRTVELSQIREALIVLLECKSQGSTLEDAIDKIKELIKKKEVE